VPVLNKIAPQGSKRFQLENIEGRRSSQSNAIKQRW